MTKLLHVIAGTQKFHKGVITNLLGARDERSFSWFGRGWELRLDWFLQQAWGHHDARVITDAFMGSLYRYGLLECNRRGRHHFHAVCCNVKYNMHRAAIEDGAEEIGYEDLEEMNDRRRRLAGEDDACKPDNKTYGGARRFDGDDKGPGYSGGGYGGWNRGGHDYSAPART